MSTLEENKTIGELKVKTNKLDYDVFNITVYQNLSSAQTDNSDISDFPIIYQTNGKVLFKFILYTLSIQNILLLNNFL